MKTLVNKSIWGIVAALFLVLFAGCGEKEDEAENYTKFSFCAVGRGWEYLVIRNDTTIATDTMVVSCVENQGEGKWLMDYAQVGQQPWQESWYQTSEAFGVYEDKNLLSIILKASAKEGESYLNTASGLSFKVVSKDSALNVEGANIICTEVAIYNGGENKTTYYINPSWGVVKIINHDAGTIYQLYGTNF